MLFLSEAILLILRWPLSSCVLTWTYRCVCVHGKEISGVSFYSAKALVFGPPPLCLYLTLIISLKDPVSE